MRTAMCTLSVLLAAVAARAGETQPLAEPFRLEAEGKPIDVEIGHAAPFFADIDGDGRRDLLVGQYGDGKLRVYHNAGDDAKPVFKELNWFQAGDGEGKVPSG